MEPPAIPGRFSFFELDQSAPFKILSDKKGSHPKRAPAGIYDRNLVCEDCERLFSPYDDYAQKLLLQDRSEQKTVLHDGEPFLFEYSDYDYGLLKLFFLSLVWRASNSTHDFFHKIKIGPHDPRLLSLIRAQDPGSAQSFSVMLSRFPEPIGILSPSRIRVSGLSFVKLSLAEYVVYVKIDRRPTPALYDELLLRENAPLRILARDPKAGGHIDIMRRVAKEHKQRRRHRTGAGG